MIPFMLSNPIPSDILCMSVVWCVCVVPIIGKSFAAGEQGETNLLRDKRMPAFDHFVNKTVDLHPILPSSSLGSHDDSRDPPRSVAMFETL
jgi:hypothetical protein